ncbi:MAG TPA: hypothetical protein VIU45_05205 [Chitinophagaceae bacterium]
MIIFEFNNITDENNDGYKDITVFQNFSAVTEFKFQVKESKKEHKDHGKGSGVKPQASRQIPPQ